MLNEGEVNLHTLGLVALGDALADVIIALFARILLGEQEESGSYEREKWIGFERRVQICILYVIRLATNETIILDMERGWSLHCLI